VCVKRRMHGSWGGAYREVGPHPTLRIQPGESHHLTTLPTIGYIADFQLKQLGFSNATRW
jgi:hypothetical protein